MCLSKNIAETTCVETFVVGNNMQSVLGGGDDVLTLKTMKNIILSSIGSKLLNA